MVLSNADIAGRWAEEEILSLWASYDPDSDPPVAFWQRPDGTQLCCDCAADHDDSMGVDWRSNEPTSDLLELCEFEPRLGCDDCKTVIAFD